MAYIISLMSEKGGCAKTTSAVNIAGELSIAMNEIKHKHKPVLLIDTDPAGGSTTDIGPADKKPKKYLADMIIEFCQTGQRSDIRDAVIKTNFPGLDLMPSSSRLGIATEIIRTQEIAREKILTQIFNFSAYRSLENVIKMYDVINSKGRKKSEFVKKAYLVYKQNQDIPKKTMNMVNNINLLKYIANKYNIKENDQETIRKILEKTNFSEEKQLPEMNSGRMTLSFAADDEIGNELCDLFEKTDNMDKVFKLVDIVSYYVESGRDKDYLEKESEELQNSK